MRLCLVYPLQDNLLKLNISEGARTQIMTRGPFWLSTALKQHQEATCFSVLLKSTADKLSQN